MDHRPRTIDHRAQNDDWAKVVGDRAGDSRPFAARDCGRLIARRDFFRVGGGLAAVAAIPIEMSAAFSKGQRAPKRPIDVNVNVGHWPMRRAAFGEAPELTRLLRGKGVAQAWAGSLEGMLHKDVGAANARLARECSKNGRGLLLPFGTVNPAFPDWEEELRRCAEEHRMCGIRLYPNYHGYRLDDRAFVDLLSAAAERGLIVQVALAMEDERMMHPLMRVAPVDPAPLAQLVREIKGLRLVLMNALRLVRGDALRRLIDSGEVYVEISTLDGVGCVERLVKEIPVERVLFGSNAPLFYFDSAMLKLWESSLSPEEADAVCAGNALRLMRRGAGRGSRTP